MPALEDAIQLALTAHHEQTDKQGQPYILHPLRLMMQMPGETLKIIAVLHDVVEDSTITLDDLRAQGYDETIVAAVDALTHPDDEAYMDYVRRAAKNHLARQVKLADLQDNMNIHRLPGFTEKDMTRMQRYHEAWTFLKSFD